MRNEEFKEAVGEFPTGITVISTCYDKKLWGFTANSFVSVSLTPPLVSFCLNKESRSFDAFHKTEYFAINILASDQASTSKHFAHKGVDKFLNIQHELSNLFGNPLISGAICFIECQKYKQFECGDHVIFVGEVVRTQINQSKSPLLYFAKSYKEIQ